jgi:hypothetical protein
MVLRDQQSQEVWIVSGLLSPLGGWGEVTRPNLLRRMHGREVAAEGRAPEDARHEELPWHYFDVSDVVEHHPFRLRTQTGNVRSLHLPSVALHLDIEGGGGGG